MSRVSVTMSVTTESGSVGSSPCEASRTLYVPRGMSAVGTSWHVMRWPPSVSLTTIGHTGVTPSFSTRPSDSSKPSRLMAYAKGWGMRLRDEMRQLS